MNPSTTPHSADTWPIACAMLAFGGQDRAGGPIQDADPTEWADQLRQVRELGFSAIDPTDTWVRVADLEPARLADFQAALAQAGLSVPAISTSRRSVVDAERGDEYLAYSHRLIDVAPALGASVVSFGLFQALTPAQQEALWFWHAEGHHDPDDDAQRALAASRIRELAEHAGSVGIEISLEMYEDTYVGTPDDAVRFLELVGHESCGLNPDLGNLIRLHRPIEKVQAMLDKTLPHANFWHVKNYLRDEDPATGAVMSFPVPMDMGLINYRTAIRQALDLGFSGPFLCEHYGSDSLGVCARNESYIRSILRSAIG